MSPMCGRTFATIRVSVDPLFHRILRYPSIGRAGTSASATRATRESAGQSRCCVFVPPSFHPEERPPNGNVVRVCARPRRLPYPLLRDRIGRPARRARETLARRHAQTMKSGAQTSPTLISTVPPLLYGRPRNTSTFAQSRTQCASLPSANHLVPAIAHRHPTPSRASTPLPRAHTRCVLAHCTEHCRSAIAALLVAESCNRGFY